MSDSPLKSNPPNRKEGSHRYESFVLRLWMGDDPTKFHRVELRHVQTDTVATGSGVTLDWLQEELKRIVGSQVISDSDLHPIGNE